MLEMDARVRKGDRSVRSVTWGFNLNHDVTNSLCAQGGGRVTSRIVIRVELECVRDG